MVNCKIKWLQVLKTSGCQLFLGEIYFRIFLQKLMVDNYTLIIIKVDSSVFKYGFQCFDFFKFVMSH